MGLSQATNWRNCFLLQLPLAILSLVIAFEYVENQPECHPAVFAFCRENFCKVDFKGALLLIISITSQILLLVFSGEQMSWYDHRIVILSFTVVFSTLYFIYTENLQTLLPLFLFPFLKDALQSFIFLLTFLLVYRAMHTFLRFHCCFK